jgi:plasmid stabilization system protein ParE
MKIIWLSFAQRDIQSIIAHYKRTTPLSIRNRCMRMIIHGASIVADQPYVGKLSETTDGVHELHIAGSSYILVYRVVDDYIEILRVFHESQDRPSAWE